MSRLLPFICLFALGCLDEGPELAEMPPEPSSEVAPSETEEPTEDEALAFEDSLGSVEEGELASRAEVWKLELATEELEEIQGFVFSGGELFVGGRHQGALVLQRFGKKDGAPVAVERWRALKPEVEELVMVQAAVPVAMWLEDGHLEGVTWGEEEVSRQRFSAEEGGRLASAPVVAVGHGRVLACMLDDKRPLCLSWDEQMQFQGAFAFPKRYSRGRPLRLTVTGEGFMVLLAGCSNKACQRGGLAAVALTEEGAPHAWRSLPVMRFDEPLIWIGGEDGATLVARRAQARESSAWHCTPKSTVELKGGFSRVVGEIYGEAPYFLEKGHLVMRQGFPFRAYRALAMEDRPAKGKDKALALPTVLSEALLTGAEHQVMSHAGGLMWVSPPVRGRYEVLAAEISPVK